MDFPTAYATGPDDYFAKAEAVLAKRRGKNPLIRYASVLSFSFVKLASTPSLELRAQIKTLSFSPLVSNSESVSFVFPVLSTICSFTISPHAPYTVCDKNMTRVKEFARQHLLPVHIHLHETHAEVADSVSGANLAIQVLNSAERGFCCHLKKIQRKIWRGFAPRIL